jgi:hypothetical protein
MKKAFIVAAFLASLPLTSFAEVGLADNQSIGGKISSLGLGLDYSFTIAETFEGRVGFNAFKHHLSKTTSEGKDYSGDAKLGTVDFLVDWYPFTSYNGLRMTAGLMYNKNKLSLSRSSPEYGGVTENANADFRKVAPYLGIGWTGKKKDTGFSMAADLGVLFQGKPNTSVTAVLPPGVSRADLAAINCHNSDGTTIDCATALDQGLANDNQSLADALKNFRFYPVVSVTASYMF